MIFKGEQNNDIIQDNQINKDLDVIIALEILTKISRIIKVVILIIGEQMV